MCYVMAECVAVYVPHVHANMAKFRIVSITEKIMQNNAMTVEHAVAIHRECTDGEDGEIWIQSNIMSRGYWG